MTADHRGLSAEPGGPAEASVGRAAARNRPHGASRTAPFGPGPLGHSEYFRSSSRLSSLDCPVARRQWGVSHGAMRASLTAHTATCAPSWPGWRGRSGEWCTAVGLLGAAEGGRGGVLLIEGASGMGKSRLLCRAADLAAHAGFAILQGAADELSQLRPLAPLTSALGESAESLLPGR